LVLGFNFRGEIAILINAGKKSSTRRDTRAALQLTRAPSSPSHAGLQVRRGAVEEEAERCAPLPSARARVGVPPAALRVPRDPAHPTGQGSPPRLQGQARILHLPRTRPPWWPQEAGEQGELCSSVAFTSSPSRRPRRPAARLFTFAGSKRKYLLRIVYFRLILTSFSARVFVRSFPHFFSIRVSATASPCTRV
jgi:hypothetical protein